MTPLPDTNISTILSNLQYPLTQEKIAKIHENIAPIISDDVTDSVAKRLKPLINTQFNVLQIPRNILMAFEPSQIGTSVGTIMDACIPELHKIVSNSHQIETIGLRKHEGILGEREGYPDFILNTGERLELKLLYVDPTGVQMKKPPTPREPSARLTQKVTFKNIDPSKDLLLLIAYQLQPMDSDNNIYCPIIIDLGVFPIAKCILARDVRLINSHGKWFGDFETPAILSKIGKQKYHSGHQLNDRIYGRKESEGLDYNEDTNFGKIARIPYSKLLAFITKNGAKINCTAVF